MEPREEIMIMQANRIGMTKLVRHKILAIAIFAVCFQGCGADAKAIAIAINLGASPHITPQVTTSFDALNGLTVAGQAVSLDFTFTGAEFVRLFTITSQSFSTLVTLQTN